MLPPPFRVSSLYLQTIFYMYIFCLNIWLANSSITFEEIFRCYTDRNHVDLRLRPLSISSPSLCRRRSLLLDEGALFTHFPASHWSTQCCNEPPLGLGRLSNNVFHLRFPKNAKIWECSVFKNLVWNIHLQQRHVVSIKPYNKSLLINTFEKENLSV